MVVDLFGSDDTVESRGRWDPRQQLHETVKFLPIIPPFRHLFLCTCVVAMYWGNPTDNHVVGEGQKISYGDVVALGEVIIGVGATDDDNATIAFVSQLGSHVCPLNYAAICAGWHQLLI